MLGKCFSRSTSFGGLLSAKALFVLGFAFVFMTSLVFSSVFSSSAYASTYSLSMSTSGTVSVDVSVSGNGASVTEDDLVVTSTCPLGYTITIQGPADTTLYKDGNSANNNTTTKISPSTGTIVSPASILGNNQGTWGYTLGNDITASSNFIGLTSTSNTLITKAQQSGDGTVLTDTIPVYYGVSVQPNQVPGLYTMAESQTGAGDNVVTYFITTPTSCTSYTVSFNPTSTAGGNTLSGTGTMGNQTIQEGVATPLNTNSFTAPEGYVFKEWNTSQDGTGTSYTDGQSVTDLTTVGQNITLYAQWKPREYTITFITNNAESIVFNGVAYTNGQTTSVIAGTYHIYGNYGTRYAFSSWSATAGTFENQTYQNTAYTVTGDATITLTGQYVNTTIQNLAYSTCSTTATPVYDTRDNSVYWIQKLPDNNCWMLDNLALDLTNSTIVNSLSNTNTNLNINALTYFKNGGGTASDRYPITAYSTFGSTNSYSQPLTNLASKDITLRPASAENYTNSTEGAYGQGQGKIGGYYNYCAASVGYYCFGNGTSVGTSTGNNDYDACPAGWRMPTGGSAGEYDTLYTTSAINSDAATYRNALSALFSGGFSSGAAYELSSTGRFWSSTRASNNSLYYLVTRSDGINLTNSRSRDSGYSVRCINPSYYTITFKTNNATGVVFNGVTYTDGQTAKIPKGEAANNKYHIYGTYGTRYAFSSWSTTAGTFENQAYQNTAYTVTGDATITLTGQYVNTVMQNISASSCSTAATPVYDNRDSSIYWIQRLPDGRCWTLDNLALDLTNSTVVNNLSASNTHLDTTSLAYFKNGGGTSSDRYPTVAYGTFGVTDSYSQPLTNMASKDVTLMPSGTSSYTGSIEGAYGQGQGKIGGYYNYCAASVGYYCFGDGDSYGTSSGDNDYDVCPAGWRMPSGNTSGEYGTLYAAAGINNNAALYREALSTPLSGSFFSGAASSQGAYGNYYSSTRSDNGSMYRLNVYSNSVYANYTYYRFRGSAVRCILREYYTISYNANGGSGSIADQSSEVGTNSSIILADNAFTRTNYYFKGWATSSGGSVVYHPAESVVPTSSMTLYAVWGTSTNTNLYNAVASLTRGMQTNDTNATTGIKTHPSKATSGVYTYDASTFGTSSDAANTNAIYYYRGILDTDLDGTASTYGSNGDSMNYPNYVKLGDMCWRIVRTTGSGGVKMIYNGSYSGGTTANSCANATTDAQLTTQSFNAKGNVGPNNIISVGYTFNSSYIDTTTDATVGELFGTNSTYTNNNTRSTIKTYIEDTWYASNMTSYTSKLEASAGYCNDRSIYNNGSFAASAVLGDNTSISVPFTTASSGNTEYKFGAYARNSDSAQAPSLACPYATRDLYRYVSGSSGTGNQLKYPVALLTADEASFAGSGNSYGSNGSGYSYDSYLYSGENVWLLSPNGRNGQGGRAYVHVLYSYGSLNGYVPTNTHGVRPVISLIPGTKIAGGSGTATAPWTIQ